MSGAQQQPTAADDLATVAAGVTLAEAHPFMPKPVAVALRALLRLVMHQHQAITGLRAELDNMKGAR